MAQGVLNRAKLSRDDIPNALQGLKAAAKTMPHVKDFINNFSDSLDLNEEIKELDLSGDGIDLLGSKYS